MAKQAKKQNSANVGFEETLWSAADKMRNNMDPAEYKHVVLGLIFLKYISDSFEEVAGKISKADKNKLERNAMKEIKSGLSAKIGNEVYGLWEEFEKGFTIEARFVKAIDKLEAMTHLLEAGYKGYDKPELIPIYADQAVENFPELIFILREIKRRLKLEFEKGKIPWKKEYDYMLTDKPDPHSPDLEKK